MKITKTIIKNFELDQKDNGTGIALTNLVWQLAKELLNDIGVKSIKTTYWKENSQVW